MNEGGGITASMNSLPLEGNAIKLRKSLAT